MPSLRRTLHSVCLKCLREKVFRHEDNTLDCPKCGMNHEFFCGICTVPVNPYIICSVKKSREQSCIGRTEQCAEHDRELKFFCWDVPCQKAICSLCVKGEHRDHHWDDLEQAEEKLYEKLCTNSDSLKNFVNVQKETIMKMEEENSSWTKHCEKQVENERKTVIGKLNEMFDKLRAQISSQKIRVDGCIQETVCVLNDASQEITEIEDSTHETTGYRYIIEKQSTLDNLETLQEVYSLESYEYTKQYTKQQSGHKMSRLVGNLMKKGFQSVTQSPTSEDSHRTAANGSERPSVAKRRRRSGETTTVTSTTT